MMEARDGGRNSVGQRRAGLGVVLTALLLGTILTGVATADSTAMCGAEITTDTTLSDNVGPCTGHGLVVTASNVTVNLNGFRVYASNGPEETVGVLLGMVHGVTVRNGEVQGFDAGVAIIGGGGNVVRGIAARHNVNDMAEVDTGDVTGDACSFGDGVLLLDSSRNLVVANRLVRNGPFSGIALVGNSDDNEVTKNHLVDHHVLSRSQLLGIGRCGRLVQDIGIRVEGPGADRNLVQRNAVLNSGLAGIGLHGYVCADEDEDGQPDQENNSGNVIRGNAVKFTGANTYQLDAHADGISVLQQGPAGTVCVAHGNTISENTVTNNYRDGIFVGGRGIGGEVPDEDPDAPPPVNNTINDNIVRDNRRDGLRLTGPSGDVPGTIWNVLVGNRGSGNGWGPSGGYDGADYNTECDDNRWKASAFVTVNQECVRGTT